MKLSVEAIIAAAGVLVALFVGVLSARVAHDVAVHGQIPKKTIEKIIIGPLDPLSMSFDPSVNLQATVEDKTYHNIQIATLILRNAGLVPILPSDIFEPIGVMVNEPYKIVTAYTPRLGANAASFTWERTGDREFRTKPTLLNPGDQVQSVVLITNDKPSGVVIPNAPKATLTVIGRIVNMQYFSDPQTSNIPYFQPYLFVTLYDWGIVIFLTTFSLYLFVYLFFSYRIGLFSRGLRISSIVVIATSLLSAAASEAGCTYLFGTFKGIYIDRGVNDWINAPWIILNIGAMIAYYSYVRRRLSLTAAAGRRPGLA